MEQVREDDKLASIIIVSTVDKQKFKVLVKECNLDKLKISEIKRNLQQITGIPESGYCMQQKSVLSLVNTAHSTSSEH